MVPLRPSLRERLGAVGLSTAIVAALGWALVAGLAPGAIPSPRAAVELFAIAPPPPPPPPQPLVERPAPRPHQPEREGASAPPNRRSEATQTVAPPPIVPRVQPPLIVVAPRPSFGADASSGAAPIAGPGTGAGGQGNGTGNGRSGDGAGGGGTAGRILQDVRFRDLPAPVRDALWRVTTDYTVYVSFVVLPTGRAVDCTVTRSSGYPALDVATCRGIIDRARFVPERDAAGRPIPKRFSGPHFWEARGVGPADGDGNG